MIGGRLFGVTDGTRYASTDLIDNPVMLLEYVKRNQNWSSGSALIRTGSADGSFDDSSLDELKALSIARQISNESEQWTDAITKSICEAFYMVSRQDSEGYECVEYVLKSTTPSDTVAIADIIPGTIGVVEEPRAENIFVEPFVQYAYDYASGAFTKSLRIEGVTGNVEWSAALTPGFEDDDGEALWNLCRANYLKYGRFERIPSVISDQYWMPDYDAALWKIGKIIEWSAKKRFSFSVLYGQARSWYAGKQIYVNFPNETNGTNIRSVITRIVKHKSQNKVDIGVVFLDEIPTNFYFTRYQATDGAETAWQEADGATDVYQEQG
jgi:hypothetical protein